MVFPVLIVVFTGLYAVLLGVVLFHLRTSPTPPLDGPNTARISIIVAARNEEHHIATCLDALLKQDVSNLEILIANDASNDQTAEIVTAYENQFSQVKAIHLEETDDPHFRGKARAIHAALQQATGDLILITDADCTPPPVWASQMRRYLLNPQMGMVCGLTLVHHKRHLDRLQTLDWMYLLGISAGFSHMGHPITAMGNNMAFRRSAYEAVGGYPALPFSVTEDYALFQAIHQHPDWEARLLFDPVLVNWTEPLASWRKIFQQRKRWARGGLRVGFYVYLIYTIAVLTHMLLVAGLFFHPGLTLGALLGKVTADGIFLGIALKRFAQWPAWRALGGFELHLFAYLCALPFVLLLRPKIQWKDRQF